MKINLPQVLTEQLKQFTALIEQKLREWTNARDPQRFREMEEEVHQICGEFGDAIVAQVLKIIVTDVSFQTETLQAARSGRKYQCAGTRQVKIQLLGGTATSVRTAYIRPDHRGRPGRKRKQGHRGKGGAGLYPALAALGIWDRVTPALASEVCYHVTNSESLRAGLAALARRNITLEYKKALRLVNSVSTRAVKQRQQWLEQARANPPKQGFLAGKRVVIATDGGRIRERLSSNRGRRRAKTHHRGYQTPWREPKLLVIYAIDEDGEQLATCRPIYDGSLGDCNATFEMLLGYLRALGGCQARQLIVLGDGAKWIWERVGELASKLGIAADKVTQVIDWCHAFSTLHTIADKPCNWSDKQKNRWVHKAKKLLHAGQIEELVAHIDGLAKGRRAKSIKQHRSYFAKNRSRMQYASYIKENVPTGSGAVESAIRCIVNHRLKGSGKFWNEVNAEGMLLLRSYLKAERFQDLFDWSMAQAAPWWQYGAASMSSPIMEGDA